MMAWQNTANDKGGTFIEVDHFQIRKDKQNAFGDVFYSKKNPDDNRIITTLSDGLGSGIKAGVLATLTSTMISNFVLRKIPIRSAAEIIMNTLPVSKETGLSYATFTTIDITPGNDVKIVEYDNPRYILLRHEEIIDSEVQLIPFERKDKNTGPSLQTQIFFSSWRAEPGDRIVFFSDGVTQSGIGTNDFSFGWKRERVAEFIIKKISDMPEISARELSQSVVQKAVANDGYSAQDDISCGVIYFRHPRNLLVMTGPPWQDENDREFARIFSNFSGKKIISGGTTAKILARELGLTIKTKRAQYDFSNLSEMEGADLITEGIITLAEAAKILEKDGYYSKNMAAVKMTDAFLESDRIKFVVGTKINDANYDPSIPVELEVRRTVVKRIAAILESKYLKEVNLNFF